MRLSAFILFATLICLACAVVPSTPPNEILAKIDAATTRAEIDALRPAGQLVSEHCYIPHGRTTCAPQFIIPGSMKCGTTSLYSYLVNHPQIDGLVANANLQGKGILADKEIRFFSGPFDSIARKTNITDAVGAYYDLFEPMHPEDNPPRFAGDATPMYVCKVNNAKRAYFTVPHSKIIAMVREPGERIYSEFFFKRALGRSASAEENTAEIFPKCVMPELHRLEGCNIANRAATNNLDYTGLLRCATELGQDARKNKCETARTKDMCAVGAKYCSSNALLNSFYAVELKEWITFFGDNVLVIKSEDFYSDTPRVMDQITAFIGAEPFDWEEVTHHVYNIVNPGTLSSQNQTIISSGKGLGVGKADTSNARPPMANDIKATLRRFFDPMNRALGDLLGQDNFWPLNQ